MSAASQLLARVGRHSLVYGFGLGLTVLTGLASLAVFTRLMAPGEFGELALLLGCSTALTLISTVGLVQGVLNAVFGAGEDDGDELGDEEDSADSPVGRKREALGTGLILATMSGSVAAAAVWLNAGWIAERLLGDAGEATAVQLAGVVGGLGAVWRLLQTIPRLERRPVRYVVLEVARPVLALVVAVPFVVDGDGPEGVLIGLAIATGAMSAIALVVMRKTYRLRFEPWVLPIIVRRGAAFVPYGIANWVMAHGGVFILSVGVSNAEVGFYRVAATLGNVIMYVASVFFMAWMPLKRTSLFAAMRNERGHGWIGGKLTTWFVVGTVGLLVALEVAADVLVRVAGPEYGEAAGLIPIVGCAALAHALFLLAYRVSAFPHKRLALGLLAPLAAVVFVGAGLLLVPHLGTKSVPLAAIGGYAISGLGFVVLGQRGRRRVDFEYGKLGLIVCVAGGCIVAHQQLSGVPGAAGVAIDIALLLAYPALLLALRVVTPREARVLARVANDSVRPTHPRRPELLARLQALPTEHLGALYGSLGPGKEAETPAPSNEEVAAALRVFSEGGAPTAHDQAVGRYLVSDLSRAERDALARTLMKRGVDPGELDHLEQALEALRRLPAASWNSAMRSSYGPSWR